MCAKQYSKKHNRFLQARSLMALGYLFVFSLASDLSALYAKWRSARSNKRLLIALCALLSSVTPGALSADTKLTGNSPAYSGSTAALIIGDRSISWNSIDPVAGNVDTGQVAPGLWRQVGSYPTTFLYTSGALRLSGQVGKNGSGLYAVVDLLSNGRRVRYLLVEEASSPLPDPPIDPYPGPTPVPTPAIVKGRVTDATTRCAIAGATVRLQGGPSTSSGATGEYQFVDAPTGSQTLVGASAGFYESSQQVEVSEYGITIGNIQLTAISQDPTKPVITSVKPQCNGIYLWGVPFQNSYEVAVVWNGQPGVVNYDVNGIAKSVSGTASGGQFSLDMGHDLIGGVLPSTNTIAISAVNAAGLASELTVLHPLVLPTPPWSAPLGVWAFHLAGAAGQCEYSFGLGFRIPPTPWEAKVTPSSWFPIIGGKGVGVQETQIAVDATLLSSGIGEISGKGGTGFEVAGQGLSGSLGGKGTLRYRPNTGISWESAQVDIAIAGKIVPPAVPLSDLIVPGSGTIAKLLRPVLKAEIESEFGPSLASHITLYDASGDLKFLQSSLDVGVSAEIALALASGKRLAEIRFYAGGTSYVTILVPADPSFLKSVNLNLYAGVEVRVWIFSGKVEAAYAWVYPSGAGPLYLAVPVELVSQEQEMRPIELNLQRFGPYSVLVPPPKALASQSASEGGADSLGRGAEASLVQNIYTFSTPVQAQMGDRQLIAFVYYDPTKPSVQATNIVYAWLDGGTLSEPQPIADDNRAEFAPQLAPLADGSVMAVWERVRDADFTGDTIEEMAPEMEIVYSVYDPASAAWSSPTQVTDNWVLDHRPLLLAAPSGQPMLLWERNSANELDGTAAHPSQILYSTWSGHGWSPTANAVASFSDAFEWTGALSDSAAVLLWSQDRDGDPETTDDRELYGADFDGSAWQLPRRITNDSVADTVPRAITLPGGGFLATWLRGNEYVELTDWQNGSYSPIMQGVGAEVANAALVADSQGNAYLLWEGLTSDGPNILYRVRSGDGQWGEESQLTHDQAMEQYLSAVASSEGGLHLLYNKVETVLGPVTFDSGGGSVTIENVPQPGRSDLYALAHRPGADLSIAVGDVQMSEPNAAPGSEVTLSAKMRNSGDRTVEHARLAFYERSAAEGDVEIGTLEASEPMRPGTEVELETTWTVPTDGRTSAVYAMADPQQEIAEIDEDNNRAFVYGSLPDLRLSGSSSTWLEDGALEVVATVANDGAAAVGNLEVDLRRDSPDGALLDRRILSYLAPGAESQTALRWRAEDVSVPSDGALLYIVADPEGQILESSEDNNSRGHLVGQP